MSDTGRTSMTSKAGAAMKPDSQKTTTEKLGDQASGTYDRVAGSAQPQSQKSATQKAGDTLQSGGDTTEQKSKGITQSMSDTVSSAAQSVSDTLGGDNKGKK